MRNKTHDLFFLCRISYHFIQIWTFFGRPGSKLANNFFNCSISVVCWSQTFPFQRLLCIIPLAKTIRQWGFKINGLIFLVETAERNLSIIYLEVWGGMLFEFVWLQDNYFLFLKSNFKGPIYIEFYMEFNCHQYNEIRKDNLIKPSVLVSQRIMTEVRPMHSF